MSATGLDPDDIARWERNRVAREALAEFDRLMAQGGIEAVVEALKKEQETQ